MLRISLIGCGNIASIIQEHCIVADIVAVLDMDKEKSIRFAQESGAEACQDIEGLLRIPSDIVVEAAAPIAVRNMGRKVLESGKDLMVMSVGGLAEKDFREGLLEVARRNGKKIYIPSGAIGGLDAISSANVGKIDSITLETTKPPSSLGIDNKERELVFEGSPEEAIKLYPKNINVSVTLSIIAGTEKVKVRIFSDPAARSNMHKVVIKGDIGELKFNFVNRPSPNMATSLLAGYSAVALLNRIDSPLQF